MNLNSEIDFFDRITLLDVMFFTRYLSIMLKSGFPINEALDAIAKQSKNARFRKVIKRIQHDVENGKSLYDSMTATKVFDAVTLSLIKIGEEAGTLEQNLLFVAETLKKRQEFSGKVTGALLYPSIVLVVAITAGMGVSLFVLPKLVDLFASMNATLPLSTQILLAFANIMKLYGVFIIAGLVLLFGLIQYTIRANRVVRYAWENFILHLPVVTDFSRDSELATIFRNLGVMIKSGLNIVTAFEVVRDSTENLVYNRLLTRALKSIERGNNIYDVFAKEDDTVLPTLAARMIGVGGKSGKLEDSFLFLATFFEEELDDLSKNLSTVLEPAMLLIVGLVVAFVVSAMLLPIYDFTSSIHG